MQLTKNSKIAIASSIIGATVLTTAIVTPIVTSARDNTCIVKPQFNYNNFLKITNKNKVDSIINQILFIKNSKLSSLDDGFITSSFLKLIHQNLSLADKKINNKIAELKSQIKHIKKQTSLYCVKHDSFIQSINAQQIIN